MKQGSPAAQAGSSTSSRPAGSGDADAKLLTQKERSPRSVTHTISSSGHRPAQLSQGHQSSSCARSPGLCCQGPERKRCAFKRIRAKGEKELGAVQRWTAGSRTSRACSEQRAVRGPASSGLCARLRAWRAPGTWNTAPVVARAPGAVHSPKHPWCWDSGARPLGANPRSATYSRPLLPTPQQLVSLLSASITPSAKQQY